MERQIKYTLSKIKNKKTGTKKYLFIISKWGDIGVTRKLHEVLDPFGNRQIAGAGIYKFNTKNEAESLIILAKLKGLL